jgi:hypothetical protein
MSRGVSEIGGRIRPSANTGLDVIAFSWTDFLDDFSRKYESSSIDGLQGGAKSVDRGGGGQWAKFSGFIGGPVGLVGKEGGSEITEKSGEDGGFDQNAGGSVATLPCGQAGGFGDRASGAGEVGIAEDDGGIFSTEFESDVFGGIEGSEFREKCAACRKRAGKDNGTNAGIEGESAGEMGAALSYLENSWRKDGGDELDVAGTNVGGKRGGL